MRDVSEIPSDMRLSLDCISAPEPVVAHICNLNEARVLLGTELTHLLFWCYRFTSWGREASSLMFVMAWESVYGTGSLLGLL